MKQIFAICLIFLLIFNWYGYQFVFNYLQSKADNELNTQLDNNQYSEAELIEIRIPLNMPYQNNSSGFERVYGEVIYNGNIYSFVKRKIDNGYLILKCIPNLKKENIQKERREIAKTNTGIDQDQKSSSPSGKILKNPTPDFLGQYIHISIHSYQNISGLITDSTTVHVCAGFETLCQQPPDIFIS